MYARSAKQLKCPASREGSRAAANAYWEAKQAELDALAVPVQKPHQAEYERYIGIYRKQAQWCSQHLAENTEYDSIMRAATESADALQHVLDHEKEPPAIDRWDRPFANISDEARAVWHDRLRHIRTAPAKKTIRYHADKWLEKETVRARSGEISSDRFSSYRYAMNDFVTWAGGENSVEIIVTDFLESYHGFLLKEINKREDKPEKGMARSYAKERMDVAKAFTFWLHERDLIPLPKILLNRKALRIKLNASQHVPEIPPLEEVRALLHHKDLPERCRLWLYLMANCGMYQVDVAKLRKGQVNLKKATITRKRSKTEHHPGVPEVTYKLWPATLALLRNHPCNHPVVALTNEDGGPLMRKWIDDDGNPQKISNIDSAYARWKRKNKVTISLGKFRKCSANLLFNNKEFRGLHTLFLGHSKRSVAEISYTDADKHMLDDAVAWLGTQYEMKSK